MRGCSVSGEHGRKLGTKGFGLEVYMGQGETGGGSGAFGVTRYRQAGVRGRVWMVRVGGCLPTLVLCRCMLLFPPVRWY